MDRLFEARLDLEHGPDPGGRLDGGQRVAGDGDRNVEGAQGRLRPADVVGVVHADAHLDEAAEASGDEAELTASLGAGEPAVLLGEPELPVVGAGLLQVGDREGDGTETVQCHGILLKR